MRRCNSGVVHDRTLKQSCSSAVLYTPYLICSHNFIDSSSNNNSANDISMNVDSDELLSPDHFPLPPSDTPMEPIVSTLLASESNLPSQDDSSTEHKNPPDARPPTPESAPNDDHEHQSLGTSPVADVEERDIAAVEDALASRSRSVTPDNDTGLGDEPSFALAERVLSACGNPSPPPQTAELPEETGSAPENIAYGGVPLERLDSRQSSPVPVTNDSEALDDNALPEGPSAPTRSTFDFVFPVNASLPVDHDIDTTPLGPSRSSRGHTPEPLLSDSPAILEPSSSGRRRSARLGMKREKIELEALALGLESPDMNLKSRVCPQPAGDLFQQASPSKSRTSPRKHAKSPLSILDAPNDVDHTPDVAMDSPPQSPSKSRYSVKGKGKSRTLAAWHPEETGVSFMSVFKLDGSIRSDVFYGNGYTPGLGSVQPALFSQDVSSLPSEDSAQPKSQLDGNIESDKAREEEILEALDSVHVTPPRERAAKRRTTIDKALLAANVQRPKTPSKSDSPEKASLGLGDPQRTPARRVTMEEAVADGSISPAKAVSVASKPFGANIVRPPVFIRPALDDPQRSPAGKGLLAQKHKSQPQESEKKERMTVQRPSPSRSSRIPNTTIIKPPLKSTVIKNRELLRPPPSSSSSSAKPQNQAALPFPLSPTKPSAAKPAGSGAPSSSSSRVAASRNTTASSSRLTRPKAASAAQTSLARSTLKEPTSATSKIPRIGAKPYTRTPSTVKPSRPVRSDSSVVVKKIANLALTPNNSPHNEEPAKDTTTSEDPLASQKTSPEPPELKTEPEKQDAQPVDPVIQSENSVTSQVAPMPSPPPSDGMAISPEIRNAPMPSPGPSEQMVISPVVDQSSLPSLGAPLASEAAEAKTSTSADHEETTEHAGQRSSKRSHKDDEGELGLGPLKRMRRNTSPGPFSSSSSPPSDPASAGHTDEDASEIPVLASSTDVDSQDEFEGRRMTRTRTSSARAGQTAPRPAPSRRRARAPAMPDPLFAGLDPVALKALTNTNTTRNQYYLSAQIEVLLVRKDGRRPDSPTVKVKTMMQKEKEDRTRERSERAARRARRSDGFDSDAGDAEESGLQQSPLRHRLGAGDEEEYMSPLRGRDSEKAPKKHVKWNYGLFSVAHLDEIVPQPNKPALVDKSALKGILSETIKTTELDRMGNHPLAEIPLSDLPQERVVVQHFLYENDQQTLPPPPPPEPIPPKVTRSKGKKAKS